MNAENTNYCYNNPSIGAPRKHDIPWKTRPDGSQFGKCLLCECWVGLKTSKELARDLRKARIKKVRAVLSDAPCTSSCWHAEGFICACSCGGKNHGIGCDPTEEGKA